MICGSCKSAAKLWKVGLCDIEGFPHSSGEYITECERVVRHEIERGGGAGQLLVATKSQHREQGDAKGLLYKVTELHGPDKCAGSTWCDCQHHVLPK